MATDSGLEAEATEPPASAIVAAAGRRTLLAWGVHLYTGLGLVLAAAMAVLIIGGTETAFRWAFGLMMVATLLDATDGPLARRLRVGEVLPGVDGRRLDDIVDFHTYTSLPLLLLWRSGLLPGPWGWLLLVPLLASAYGFSRVDAKTEDGFFLGFPSYWNVVAFYLFFLQPPPTVSAGVVLAFSGLTVLPWRYLKPGGASPLERLTLFLTIGWGIVVVGVLAGPLESPGWVLGSLALPAWYLGASWALEGRARRGSLRR
jgi:phosphatidylcholine synthase